MEMEGMDRSERAIDTVGEDRNTGRD
jgi:hypothetical protein